MKNNKREQKQISNSFF